jgi:hypothetical protein
MLAPFAPSDDVELLCELASGELPVGQTLHGDAHLFNCIETASGPVWHDLETACRGPREYDLAALVLDDRSQGSDPEARAALAAYRLYDEDILERALPVYASWVAASFMVAVARRPDAAPTLERQLRFCGASAVSSRGHSGSLAQAGLPATSLFAFVPEAVPCDDPRGEESEQCHGNR